ncbi:unnamed protein product [Dovyalis caffra]|uniref:Uncharacterized protein n=1 Tax=Dovyalis caffra TaxID=77055 RepID=A0AAV1RQ26_9ROSI|nr:unnamed protein product [Dovyalis caffra]
MESTPPIKELLKKIRELEARTQSSSIRNVELSLFVDSKPTQQKSHSISSQRFALKRWIATELIDFYPSCSFKSWFDLGLNRDSIPKEKRKIGCLCYFWTPNGFHAYRK